MGFFFEEIFYFAKTTEFSLKGGWGTATLFTLSLSRARERGTTITYHTYYQTDTALHTLYILLFTLYDTSYNTSSGSRRK